MNNGLHCTITVSRFVPGSSLIRRLSCVGGEPGNEATAMSDELVTVNTWNTDKFIVSVKAS